METTLADPTAEALRQRFARFARNQETDADMDWFHDEFCPGPDRSGLDIRGRAMRKLAVDLAMRLI